MQSAINADGTTTTTNLAVLLQVSPMRGNQSAEFDEGDWVPEAETPPSSRSGCFKLDFDVSHTLYPYLLINSTIVLQFRQLIGPLSKSRACHAEA